MAKKRSTLRRFIARRGFAWGPRLNPTTAIDEIGRLYQMGEAIWPVANDINTGIEESLLKNRWRFWYEDDFLEDAGTSYSALSRIPTYWDETETETGSVDVVNEPGGILHLSTGATASSVASLLWANAAAFNAGLRPVMLTRLQEADTAITEMTLRWGFRKDDDDYCYFEYDPAVDAEHLYVVARANGGSVEREMVVDNVGTTAGDFRLDAFHWYRLEVRNGYWVAEIDGVEVGSGVEIEDDEHMPPYLYADNKANAAERGMKIDYALFSAERDV